MKRIPSLAQVFISCCVCVVVFLYNMGQQIEKRVRIETTTRHVSTNQKIWLLRTIGNALPPRHDREQSLKNIEFVLKNEIQDPLLHKHWILNRIVDPVFQDETIQLLKRFNTSYSVLPFNLQEYSQYRYNAFDHRGRNIVGTGREQGWKLAQRRSAQRDDKIIQTLNVNGARNAMLQYGRDNGARWILPWDQSCFLTSSAWEMIRNKLTTSEKQVQYLYTWMVRIHGDNQQVLEKNYQPIPAELHGEPQLIFRNDASERFDPGMRYGRRDKAAFLVRLKIPGQWDRWYWDSYERPRTYLDRIKQKYTVPSVGYAVRLNSGKPELEKLKLSYFREMARAEALFSFLDRLDARVLTEIRHFSPLDMMLFDSSKLRIDHDKSHSAVVKKLEREIRINHKPSVSRMIQSVAQTAVLGTLTGSAAYYSLARRHLEVLVKQPEDSILELVQRSRDGYLFLICFCDSLRLLGESLEKDLKVAADQWLSKLVHKLKVVEDGQVGTDAAIIATAGFTNHTPPMVFRADTAWARLPKSTVDLESLVPWSVTAVLLKKVSGINLWKEHDGLLCTAVRRSVPCCSGSETATKCELVNDYRQSFLATQALLHCEGMTPSCRALGKSKAVQPDFPFDLLRFV